MQVSPLVEISIVPFKHKYLQMVIELHALRNCPYTNVINCKNLPRTGYIAILNNQPIAAGFLRRVEGRIGMIDALVSNPYFGSKIRHEGIEKVVNSLLKDAKSLKLEGIISYTHDEGVLSRAKELGFKEIEGEKLIVLPLSMD